MNNPDLTTPGPIHHDQHHYERVDFVTRLVNFIAVTLPILGLTAAIILLWGVAFNWVYLMILGVMYVLTGLGITVGYHRYFTHRSFKTSAPVAATLAALGSMAVEGPILQWAAVHRSHHQHSDHDDDPHSPHTHGAGVWGVLKGFWHAHMGWLFRSKTRGLARYVPDLRRERLTRWMSRLFPLWVFLGLVIPAALGGVLTLSWTGVLLGFIWGGLVRIFLVHHITWSVNSVCHIWGSRAFRSHDHSRNNPIFGVLAFGEGWHNNHHAFPTSARHGLRWWQLDISYLVIRAMAVFGLVSEIRIPTPERIAAKRLT
ncbi:MAG: acyl-CoA desaturase [Phycisphaeraceae bacterium]|nr:acyl-CoA desaturase [Phycisphaerales bacterium]MCB9844244.1 acyl-CoA desaturase [Phycisphaeraceae bacterium]